MKIDKVQKNINDQDYEISTLPAKASYSLFIKVTSIIGISLSSFFKAIGDKEDLGYIGEAIAKLISGIYHNDPKCSVIFDILNQTTRNGVAITSSNFDEIYTGNIEESVMAIYESLRVHLTPFLAISKLSGNLITK